MENSKNIFNEDPKSSLVKVLDIIATMASKPSGFIGLAILIFHVTLAISSPFSETALLKVAALISGKLLIA